MLMERSVPKNLVDNLGANRNEIKTVGRQSSCKK